MHVDLDSLTTALDDHSPGIEWVLDRRTGEGIAVTDPMVTGDEETEALVAGDPARYLRIEPMPSHEAFEIMEAFVESVASAAIGDRLGESLRRRHPFREFKEALSSYPEVRASWFRFHGERMTFVAKRWLSDAGLNDVICISQRPTGV